MSMDEDEECVLEGGPLQQHLSALGLGEELETIPRSGLGTTALAVQNIAERQHGFATRVMRFISCQTVSLIDPIPNVYKWVAEKVVRETLAPNQLMRQTDLQWLFLMQRNQEIQSSIHTRDWSDLWSSLAGCALSLPFGIYLGAVGFTQIVQRHFLFQKLNSKMCQFLKVLGTNFSAQKCSYALLQGHLMLPHSCAMHDSSDCPIWNVFASSRGLLPQVKATVALNIDATMVTLLDMLDELYQIKPQDFAVPQSFTTHTSLISLEDVMEEYGLNSIKHNLQILSELQARVLFLLTGCLLMGNSSLLIQQILTILTKQSNVLHPLQASLTQRLEAAKTSALNFQNMQSLDCKSTSLTLLMPIHASLNIATLHAQRVLTMLVHCQELSLVTTNPLPSQLRNSLHTLKQELNSTIQFVNAAEKKCNQLYPDSEISNLDTNPPSDKESEVNHSDESDSQAQEFEAIGELDSSEPKTFYTNTYETPRLEPDVMKELVAHIDAAFPQSYFQRKLMSAPPLTSDHSNPLPTSMLPVQNPKSTISSSDPLPRSTIPKLEPQNTSKTGCTFSDSSNQLSAISSSSATYSDVETLLQAEKMPSKEQIHEFEVFDVIKTAASIGLQMRQEEDYFSDTDSE